jgi:hypothetical protein
MLLQAHPRHLHHQPERLPVEIEMVRVVKVALPIKQLQMLRQLAQQMRLFNSLWVYKSVHI